MKNKSIIIGIIAFLAICFAATSELTADPPPWAPAHGYRGHSGYIYFPEHNFYYDIPRGGYFFYNGGNWQFGMELPMMFRHFDLRIARKVHYREYHEFPYYFNKSHRSHKWDGHKDFDRRNDRWDNDRDRRHDRRDDGKGKHKGEKKYKSNKHNKGRR